MSVWLVYIRKQKEKCGARLMEAAAHFEHGLKPLACAWPLWGRFRKPRAAANLRKWALQLFPEDGYVSYYQARYLDGDAKRCDV